MTGFSFWHTFPNRLNRTGGGYLVRDNVNIRLNTALGQNFLKTDRIARKMVESIDLPVGSIVVEIGVGSGMLTRVLLESGFSVIGFELDRRFAEVNHSLESPTCKLIYGDFLKADLGSIPNYVAYIANIPYYITSPIIERIMFEGPRFSSALLMVQKEYAERLTAQSGTKEYGVLTVNVNTFATVRELFQVSKSEFIPRPEVDSTVIELRLLERPEDLPDRDGYRDFVRRCFSQRRKKLTNNLKCLVDSPDELLLSCGIDTSVRAEKLSVSQFKKLYNLYTHQREAEHGPKNRSDREPGSL
jgi:16S rRNA (adenine1518-N6/adenine1519-N6)-dimethyltransferase